MSDSPRSIGEFQADFEANIKPVQAPEAPSVPDKPAPAKSTSKIEEEYMSKQGGFFRDMTSIPQVATVDAFQEDEEEWAIDEETVSPWDYVVEEDSQGEEESD